jgi:RNA-directed DNA polymerase
VFNSLGDYLWRLTYKWACRTHLNKPRRWIASRYYRRFSKFRNDRWVFGNPVTGAYLPKLSWTPIVRHTLVKGGASPDDPSLAAYWERRRQKMNPPLDPFAEHLLSRQDGRCSLCEDHLLTPDQPPQSPQGWERWFLQVVKTAITADYLMLDGQLAAGNDARTHLVHATCRRRLQHARRTRGTALEPCT